MSYLDRQRSAFTGNLASAASKIPNTGKQQGSSINAPRAPPSPSPSATSTASAVAGAGNATPKKSTGSSAATIYSQPENTGVGQDVNTNVYYIVGTLKEKDRQMTLQDLLERNSLDRRPESYQRELVDRIRVHPRIDWIPDPNLSEQTWRSGTYVHRPIIPGVRDKFSLVACLQQKRDARGILVKDLKDGWPRCEEALAELESEHKVLVVRTKKDGHARSVWLDDSSLHHQVEPEFRTMWARVEVPSKDDIVRRLAAVGQKPTSEDPRLKAKALGAGDKKKPKKRAARRTGKATNTHMEHLLKDYSHLKR